MELKIRTQIIRNLFSLDNAEAKELRERVSHWKGLVRVFIHPLYEKWRWGTDHYRDDTAGKKLIDIERVLERLVKMPPEKTPPIIIFEEKMYAEKLERWLRSNDSTQTNVYIVETKKNDPVPVGYDWNTLRDLFTTIGVSRILIGGIRLEICSYKTDWTGKAPYVCRCVGIALSYLSNKKAGPFNTEVSALTDPTGSREYLKTFS